MKKILGMILLLTSGGCSEQQNAEQYENIQLAEKADSVSEQQERARIEELPNADTVYEKMELNVSESNSALIAAMKMQLEKNKFSLSAAKETQWSVNDCKRNVIIQLKGTGVQSYGAESSQGMGPQKNYYPDFYFYVFTFDDEHQAELNYSKLLNAVHSGGGFCNGKAPEKLVRNGRSVFYFTTRAEMFRGYINQYAELAESFTETSAVRNPSGT